MFRRVKRWSAGVIGGLTLVVGVSGAFAQAPSAEDMALFEEFLREGTEAQKGGEYRKAIEQFEKAAGIVDHPRLQVEIGQSYENLGECKQARASYEKLGGRENLGEQYVTLVEERLAGLETCVGYGEVAVECSKSGADVEFVAVEGGAVVGGEQALSGVCPGSWRLREGEYTLIARLDGEEVGRRQVRVVEGEKGREFVQLDESVAVLEPVPSGKSTGWGVYAGAGAMGVGAVLTTIALISDAGSGDRLLELQKIERGGDAKLFAERTSENESIRTRNIVMYAGGAALLLGGGGVLAWSLLSSDGGDSPAVEAEPDWFSLQLLVQPTEVGLRLRW